jgi:hypothetical protein
MVKVKDLNRIENYQDVYRPGRVVRVAVNKLGRLSTKEKVINTCLSSDLRLTDKRVRINTLQGLLKMATEVTGISIGQEVDA